MKTILVFGSEDFAFDNGAVRLIGYLEQQLPGCKIQRVSRPDLLMSFTGKDFIILDVAKGIEKPVLITDLDKVSYGRKITAHDMDLAAFLNILKSVGKLGKVRIVALPFDDDPNKFKGEVVRLLKGCM